MRGLLPWLIVGVAVWYFFLREKKTGSSGYFNGVELASDASPVTGGMLGWSDGATGSYVTR